MPVRRWFPCSVFVACVFLFFYCPPLMFFFDVQVVDGDANDPVAATNLWRSFLDIEISMLKLTTTYEFFLIFFWIVCLTKLSIGIFLTLITLNLWSNLSLGQTSRSVTHPHTTPPPARLTSLFHPDECPRSKLYLVDNTTISILLTLIPLCHTSLVLSFQTIY